MKDFLKAFSKHMQKDDRVNFRDRRAHYASDALGCLRDLYWKRTGVPPTNPPDLVSKLKMAYGSAVGAYFERQVFPRMFKEGYFLEGAEVPAGGSDPDINCYLDALFYREQHGEGSQKEYFVAELKTASGYGATLLARSFEPKDSYLAQLGVYLKDMHNKGVTAKGCLFYFLLSDQSVGSVVQISCRYDPKTDEIVAFKGESSRGELKSLDQRYRVGKVEERLKLLDKHLADKVCPPADFVYKYEVTPEETRSWSDAKLLKAVKNEAVVGDWQVIYSSYKDLQLEIDGVELGYNEDELKVIKAEKRRRTPNSKYVK